jgi:uncharacterized protein (DUF488 family)
MDIEILTIGHSTHPLETFLELLDKHSVRVLVDVRSFPGSRRFPHFQSEDLCRSLDENGIEYHHLKALGGFRKRPELESPNQGWTNPSFRNYADHMLTPEFRVGVEKVIRLASDARTTVMCAEGPPWRCHRQLISDYLLGVCGFPVLHIMGSGEVRPHSLTDFAQLSGNLLLYPAETSG